VPFAHERLDVYQKAIEFVTWGQILLNSLPPGAAARGQLERASTSIPLNIAEGNAKRSRRDRARYWQISLGSTLECAAILDVLVARGLKSTQEVSEGKQILDRVAAMLMALLKGLGSTVAD
jgi:four helix bundle protein